MRLSILIVFISLTINELSAQKIKDATQWHKYLNGIWAIEMQEKSDGADIWGQLTFKENNVFDCQLAIQIYHFYKEQRLSAVRSGVLFTSSWSFGVDSSVCVSNTLINCRSKAVVRMKNKQYEQIATILDGMCDKMFKNPDNLGDLLLCQSINNSMITYFSPQKFIMPIKEGKKILFSLVFIKKAD